MKCSPTRNKLVIVIQATIISICMMACGSNSDVGNQTDEPPIAKGLAIGVGASNQVREGQEFILSGKDSDGIDSPIFEFNWNVSSGASQDLQLKELSVNSVAVTAPKVTTSTEIVFQLTVVDADGGTATDSVSVTVVPGRDQNKLLSYDAISDANHQAYQVTLQPEANQIIDESNSQVNLDIAVVVNYPNQQASCRFDGYDSGGTVCINYQNNASVSLAESSQTLQGSWNVNGENHAIETTFELELPEFILGSFNQSLLDSGADRVQLLESWKADDIDIEVTYTIDSATNATLAVQGVNDGQPVGLTDLSGSLTFNHGSPLTLTVEQIRNSGVGLVESKQTAQQYYDAIDPFQEADTLNKWLVSAGFATLNTEGAIELLAQGLAGENTTESDFAHALYTNNFDLGFGRDMYVRVDDEGNVYSYVTNYATLEAAAKKISPIATVVMEYTRPAQGDGTEPRFVKFYTYIPDESGEQIRATDFDFDGRGQKYMPGVCSACHGGKPKSIEEPIANYTGNIQASFLPWDLDSFLYTDTDPAITDIAEVESDASNLVYSREAQQEQFRKLNQSVFHIYNSEESSRFDPVIELMGGTNSSAGWYAEIDCPSNSRVLGCLEGSFNGEAVPEGWQDNSELYLNVVARHCRGCHLVQLGTDEAPALLQMASSEVFLAEEHAAKVRNLVFRQGTMPLARLSMDRLWGGTQSNTNPSQILWESLGEVGVVNPPGSPVPIISHQPVQFNSVSRELDGQEYLLTKTDRTIEFDASISSFTDSFEWRLLDSTNVLGFENCLADQAALEAMGAEVKLTPTMANTSSQYYCLQLTATNDVASVNSEIIFVSVTDNRLPQVLFSSDCDDENLCLSVSELNSDPASSVIQLSAVSDSEALDFADPDCALDPENICTNVSTLFQIIDQDIADGLDPPSVISFDLSADLTVGTLSANSFSLQDLLQGNVINYQATVDEVGATVETEILEFNIYDNEILVSGLNTNSAEININPVSDNSPIFGAVDSVVVNFGVTFNSSPFDVTDADQDSIELTNIPSSLGSLVTSLISANAEVTTYDYDFTAKTAEEIAGNGTICSSAEVFNGGNTGSFQLRADDASGSPDVPVTRNVAVTLTPSLNYVDVANDFDEKTASGGQCSSCHVDGELGAPRWASDIAEMRSLVNLSDPEASTIFNNSGGGHTGGTYTVDFVNNSVDRNLLEWIYQCAPQ